MSGAMAGAIALSLVSAVAYALAAVAQERLAARTETGTGLLRLLGRGAWWLAVGLNAGGALLHVVALTYGPLTVVQPLGALTLVAAVPLGARRAGRQVSRGEWRGTLFTLAGLGIILLTAAGTAPTDTLTLPQALGAAGVAMALVALLTRPGARPGLRHAAASGITSGVASALTQTVTVAATARGTDTPPIWQTAAVALLVAAFASGGLLLSQTAYRGGLGAPLAVLTLANPVAAAVIGMTLLGERLQGGAAGVAGALAGAVVAARGVVLLTRTTAVARAAEPAPAASGPATAPPSVPPAPAPAPAASAVGRPRSTAPVSRPESAAAAIPSPRAPVAPAVLSAARPTVPAVVVARLAVYGAAVWGIPDPVVPLRRDVGAGGRGGADSGGRAHWPRRRRRRCRAGV
ncbi:hypothetical protein ABZ707_03905 [Streptomyces sp. NPDC006923]|uniref:hypothetical protein n=1 Tax=Streptomyces sp. NPDC006923 TaxID=3155355 RepID=UPI0033DA7F1D